MKIQTIKYMFKEGFLNAYRNKLMSLISISMVVIMLIIFGIYNLFMLNLNYNMKILKKDYQIQVYCNENLQFNDPIITDIENEIKQNKNVQECIKVSKEEAFEKLKSTLDDPSIVEGMNNDFLPVSFTVKLKDSTISLQTSKELESITNIDKVSFSQKDMDFINTFSDWMYVSSILIAIILLLSSIFIISNTIRLTVFSRRKDINIMKYVGATDGFIRGPFLLEGAIIGAFGAIISFVVVCYGYVTVTGTITDKISSLGIYSFNILPLSGLALFLFILLFSLGILVGIVGSIVAIRKHLRV